MTIRPIAVIAMLLFACIYSQAAESLKSGRYSIKQSWSQEQDFQRPYFVRIPDHADGEKLPAFIFLHGNGGTAERALANLTGRYQELASRYIMVFPQGYAKSWNIVSEASKADDKQFVEAIIKHLASFDNVRARDFSIMGNSNGAALVNQLAIESKLPHVRNFITSVSPLNVFQHNGKNFRSKGSGNDYQSVAEPQKGIRLLNVSGTKDRLVPYRGGLSPVIPANDGKLSFLDAEESIFVWAKQMGYDGAKLTEPTNSAGSIDSFDYLDGQVVHLRANDIGHNASKALSEKRLLSFLDGNRKERVEEKDDTIVRASTLPDSTPWDLAKLSVAPKYEWSDGEQVRSLFFQGESYKGKPTRVFAYYASPATINENAKPETYPGIVLVHGGGGTAFSEWAKLWAKRGYAAIAMDLAGCGPERKRMDDGGPGQGHDMKFGTIERPITEQWTYHAVANVILSHSLLRSLPEVDSSRTALTGISWGGYLTCIVSGLDNRFDAAIPVYGCGFLHENSCWLGEFAAMTAENKAKWIKLWDPSKYVGSASMPMLFVNGGKDFAYPPDSHAKTFALVSSPKYLHFVPDLAHGHIFDRPNVIEPFVRQQLNDGEALSKISRPAIQEGRVIATVDVNRKLTESTLHYTTDALSEDPRERKWLSHAALVNDSSIESKPPPKEATAWFLTVKDERGLVTSSPLMFASPSDR